MPKLGRIADPVELDNLYSDKVVVYVEGGADLAFFGNLLGPDLADRLEFKVPEEKGSGYHAVKARVAMERGGNAKIHGLLDGDAAVALDRFEAFLEGGEVLFRVARDDAEGLLFLSEYELENIVLCHANVPDFLAAHVPFAAIGTVPIEQLQRKLLTLTRRFYLLALLKFTAGRFHRAGTPCGAVDKHEGMFDNKRMGVAAILRFLKPKIVEAGIGWEAFLAEARRFARSVNDHFDLRQFDEGTRQLHVLRMADGKNLLKRIRGDYGGTAHWEGQLHDRLKRLGYAERFRDALERETGCNDNS
jgi:hypothetical protein